MGLEFQNGDDLGQIADRGRVLNWLITFEEGINPAIATLLDAARTKRPLGVDGGLDYVATTSTYPSMVSFSHNFPGILDFDGDGVLTGANDGPTLRGSFSPAGIYTLTEQMIEGGLVGW